MKVPIANDEGAIETQYIYLDNTRAIAKLEGEELFAIHTDHLGTPRRMSDSQGVVVWDAYFEPFGKAHVVVETVSLDLRLPGQVYDAETGTHYNYFRDYDPDQGRYLTSDPIGLSGGVNTFLYAYADPIAFVDPWGLRVILMDRGLDAASPGRHMFIVIIPDNPSDFAGAQDIGFVDPDDGNPRIFNLTDLGNGEFGYVIGAQSIDTGSGPNRLIAEPFNEADTAAALQHFDPNDVLPSDVRDFEANETICSIGAANDTDAINLLLQNITNYNANEARQPIPYPGNAATVMGAITSASGHVNSNSWALSALEYSGITPQITNVPGLDVFSNNRIDTDYFASPTTTPLSELTKENTDTDGDGHLDVVDRDPLVYDGSPEGRLP